jgi:hypothetical protein
MWAVDVQTRPLRIGTPRLLFDSASRELVLRCIPTNCYFVSPDGSRFFATQILPDSLTPPVTHVRLIQGWVEEMKARVSGEVARPEARHGGGRRASITTSPHLDIARERR